MSSFTFTDLGIAASIFLALFTLSLPLGIYAVVRKGIKSPFTLLLMFMLIRFGGQLSGVVFAKNGFSNVNWLIAYLILGAEGYFALILASLYFVVRAQELNLGHSWLTTTPFRPVDRGFFLIKRLSRYSYKTLYHLLLLPSNGLVIAGGSMLAGMTAEELITKTSKVNESKALRCAGQSIFLALTFFMIACAVNACFRERIRSWSIYSVLCLSPFIVVRGIFGILSIYIQDMNYFMVTNYTNGFSNKLVIYEYVLSTTMEFITCGFLLLNLFVKDPESIDVVSSDIDNDLEEKA